MNIFKFTLFYNQVYDGRHWFHSTWVENHFYNNVTFLVLSGIQNNLQSFNFEYLSINNRVTVLYNKNFINNLKKYNCTKSAPMLLREQSWIFCCILFKKTLKKKNWKTTTNNLERKLSASCWKFRTISWKLKNWECTRSWKIQLWDNKDYSLKN